MFSTILAGNFQHISYNSISPSDLFYLSSFLEGFDTFRERMEIIRLDLTKYFICELGAFEEITCNRVPSCTYSGIIFNSLHSGFSPRLSI